MAHLVALEYSGTLIDLTAGDNLLGQYSIRPARMGDNGSYEPVSERVRVHISGTSAADLQSNVHAIEQWLSTTSERKAVGEGEKLYLQCRPDGYSQTYRAEIYDAVFVPDPDTLEQWPNYLITGNIEFTRSPYWEGPRTQLTLYNRYSVGGTTGWLRVDNRNDSTHDAFFEIAQGAVDGTVPAALELHVKNDNGANASWRTFYVGVDARSGPTSLEPVLEGEAQSGGGGTTPASADASGGTVWKTASTAADVHLYPKWTIPSSWTDKFRGRFVRVLVFLGQSFTTDWIYQVKVKDQYGLLDLFVGRPRQSVNDYQYLDLGTVPIPPVAYTSDLAELKLEIEMYHTASGNHTQEIDFILLMPTDSGRTLYQTGMTIPAGDWVIFNEIERVWVSNESGLKHPIYTPRGPGVLVFPEVANRVWLLNDGFSIDQDDRRSVKAYYRARRLTL